MPSAVKTIKVNKQETPDPGDKSLDKDEVVFTQLTERTQPQHLDSKSLKLDFLERENSDQLLQIKHLSALLQAYKQKVLSANLPQQSNQAQSEDQIVDLYEKRIQS